MILFKDLPWIYVEMLDWRFENGVVKAFPKRKLSDLAHKTVLRVFKGWGGNFVSHNGQSYFELPVREASSTSTKTAVDIKRAYEELRKET